MRYFLTIALLCLSTGSVAIEWEDRRIFNEKSNSKPLRVLSSTDISVFEPILNSFLIENPGVSIEYLVAGSTDIYNEFRQSPEEYDAVISSAMDLQLKLANDGYARRFDEIKHPDWAQWRKSLFGFTLEPAAIVVNKEAFSPITTPRSRQSMIQVLRDHIDKFKGKVATYDIRTSGLGYLFATQDARNSESYWRLMEIVGSLDARLYCCSGEMIEDVANGKIAISYNVLGSYAIARTDLADRIEVILPVDFPNTMMRTVIVSAYSQQHEKAAAFLRYLVSSNWSTIPDENSLPPLQPATDNASSTVISLEPGLMIFLDRMKRQNFIKEWENAIIQ